MPSNDDPYKILPILSPLNVDPEVKARTWDAFHGSHTEDDLQNALQSIPELDDNTRAALWDARYPPKAPSGLEMTKSALGQMGRGYYEQSPILSMPEQVYNLAESTKNARSPIEAGLQTVENVGNAIMDPIREQQAIAQRQMNEGQPIAGATRMILGSIPMVGPAAYKTAEQLSDPSTFFRGVGGAGALLSTPRLARAVEEAPGNIGSWWERLGQVNPDAALMQGVKPQASGWHFKQNLDRIKPEIKAAEEDMGHGIGKLPDGSANKQPGAAVMDAYDAAEIRQNKIYAELQKQIEPFKYDRVDGRSVAARIRASIPERIRANALEGPPAIARAEAAAAIYDQPIDFKTLIQRQKDLNAELDSWFRKYPDKQYAQAASDPETAHLIAERSANDDLIRNHNYTSPWSGENIKELNARYGSLKDFQREVLRGYNVAARQEPNGLYKSLGKISSAGLATKGGIEMLTGKWGQGLVNLGEAAAIRGSSKYLKEMQTRDALIRQAFESYSGRPEGLPYVPPEPTALTRYPNIPASGPVPVPRRPAYQMPGTYEDPTTNRAEFRSRTQGPAPPYPSGTFNQRSQRLLEAGGQYGKGKIPSPRVEPSHGIPVGPVTEKPSPVPPLTERTIETGRGVDVGPTEKRLGKGFTEGRQFSSEPRQPTQIGEREVNYRGVPTKPPELPGRASPGQKSEAVPTGTTSYKQAIDLAYKSGGKLTAKDLQKNLGVSFDQSNKIYNRLQTEGYLRQAEPRMGEWGVEPRVTFGGVAPPSPPPPVSPKYSMEIPKLPTEVTPEIQEFVRGIRKPEPEARGGIHIPKPPKFTRNPLVRVPHIRIKRYARGGVRIPEEPTAKAMAQRFREKGGLDKVVCAK